MTSAKDINTNGYPAEICSLFFPYRMGPNAKARPAYKAPEYGALLLFLNIAIPGLILFFV